MLDCLEGTEKFTVSGTCASCYGTGHQRQFVYVCPSCNRQYDTPMMSFLMAARLPCGHDPVRLTRSIADSPCTKCSGTGRINKEVKLWQIIRGWGERLSIVEHHQET